MKEQPDRADRRMAYVPADMTVGGKAQPVTIANASANGLMVRCDCPPEVGAGIELSRAGTRIAGEVVWRRGRRFGVRSGEPLDVDALIGDLAENAGALVLNKQDRVGSRIAWPRRRR